MYIDNSWMDYDSPEALASAIRSLDEWDPDLCRALCAQAGMAEEWEAAGEDFEAVVFAAADALGVEII